MKRQRLGALSRACAAGVMCASSVVYAGDLSPPAGPVAPTMKTLVQVEPRTEINATSTPGDAVAVRRITAPGSYYLGGNLNASAGKHTISIDADNVTIDLMGFNLQGNGGVWTAHGIYVSGAYENLTIRNGIIDGHGGGVGIDTRLATGPMLIEDVVVSECAGGIWGLDDMTILNSAVMRCNSRGIEVRDRAIVRNCRSIDNNGVGFYAQSHSLFDQCISRGNTSHGFEVTGSSNTFVRCHARFSDADGFHVWWGELIECTSENNDGEGFWIDSNSTVRNCRALSNQGHGIEVGGGCVVVGCLTAQNSMHGIYVVGWDNRIDSNTTRINSGDGIHIAAPRNTVTRNDLSSLDFLNNAGGSVWVGPTNNMNSPWTNWVD